MSVGSGTRSAHCPDGVIPVKMGGLVATKGPPYRQADSQVQASPSRLPSCLLGTVAGAGSPAGAQHDAGIAPCA